MANTGQIVQLKDRESLSNSQIFDYPITIDEAVICAGGSTTSNVLNHINDGNDSLKDILNTIDSRIANADSAILDIQDATGNYLQPIANLTLTLGAIALWSGTTNKLTKPSAAIGGVKLPIYINNNGIPTAVTDTVGSATRPIYLSAGVITEIGNIIEAAKNSPLTLKAYTQQDGVSTASVVNLLVISASNSGYATLGSSTNPSRIITEDIIGGYNLLSISDTGSGFVSAINVGPDGHSLDVTYTVPQDTKNTVGNYQATTSNTQYYLVGVSATPSTTTGSYALSYANSSVYIKNSKLYAPTPETTHDDTLVATAKYVEDYVTTKLLTVNAMYYAGTVAGSTGTLGTLFPSSAIPANSKGAVYVVTTSGIIDGQLFDAGDMLIVKVEQQIAKATSSNYGTILSNNFDVIQGNLTNAVTKGTKVSGGSYPLAIWVSETDRTIDSAETVGNANTPIYLNSGVPTAITSITYQKLDSSTVLPYLTISKTVVESINATDTASIINGYKAAWKTALGIS